MNNLLWAQTQDQGRQWLPAFVLTQTKPRSQSAEKEAQRLSHPEPASLW